ncbi:MAG TPA: CYTH domain-containing protein [Roseiflexaceae bacterium]|nr:CYTH domain-containing protein [Roseiflexaceae bacterium]
MEIEAKLIVSDPQVFATLEGMGSIGPFGLAVRPGVERQGNTYLDTADGRLQALRYGLRIRDLGDRRIGTLKGERQEHGGITERLEIEAEVGDAFQPRDWPEGELRQRTLELLGDTPVAPLLSIQTDRRYIDALLDGRPFAEICLDEGTISAGDRVESFRELEVELTDRAQRDAFEQLVQLVRERFALPVGHQSKLERGLRLLKQGTGN